MHSVTDGQTNGQTDDIMMPIAIIGAYCVAVYDRLKKYNATR